jgi:hypothetical protein
MSLKFDLLVRDYSDELSRLIDEIDVSVEDRFDQGRRFGLIEAASLLLQQAKAFGAESGQPELGPLANRGDIVS